RRRTDPQGPRRRLQGPLPEPARARSHPRRQRRRHRARRALGQLAPALVAGLRGLRSTHRVAAWRKDPRRSPGARRGLLRQVLEARRRPVTAVRTISGLAEIPATDWDALVGPEDSPFLRYGWLWTLEETGCITPEEGWTARHITVWRGKT